MTDDDPSSEDDSRPRSSRRPDAVDLDIVTDAPGWRRNAPAIEQHVATAARAALMAAGADGTVELSILLTDDARQRALNRDHRGKDSSTNVLSFPAGFAPPAGPRPLGDLSLALETVQRESVDQGKTLADHTSHLVVHGVLHLLGYDHGTDAQAAAMEGLERRILSGLGVADPYGDEDSGDATAGDTPGAKSGRDDAARQGGGRAA